MQEEGGGGRNEAPVLYREVQHFRMWMYWVPILVVTGLIWYLFYQQIFRDNPSGAEPLPDWAAWVLTLVFGVGFPVFGYLLRLVTEVRPEEMSLRVFPFRGSRVPLQLVAEAEVREYSAQREYGGWGVRTSSRSGKAYTAYGKTGVQLWLQDEQRILVGTQRPEELIDVLRKTGVFVR